MTEQEKERIRQRFSRAAGTYDAHALVQKALAVRLASDLPTGCNPARILEIGCGTGNLTGILLDRYPAAKIIGLDFSENMLAQAKGKLGYCGKLSLICADGERFLASCPGSFELICSNATMQWFDDLENAFANLARKLSDGGCFVGTLFGPRTFRELSLGLDQVFGRPVALASHRFADRARLEAILSPLFGRVTVREEETVRRYDSLADLLSHIRRSGASGGLSLPTALTRGRLVALDAWFCENFSGYPASFQTLVITCRK